MLLVWKLLVSAVSILSLLALCQAAGSRPNCDFPPIDIPAQKIDVLGDLEKTHVCQQPRPNKLCTRVGPPDRACKAIARAVGGVRNVTCSHPHTCAFQVKAPIQHPSRPGYAFISLCVPDFIGVIFPCRENNLIIANPFYKGVYENDNPEPEVPGDIASNPLCEFPRLDVDALAIDVLGDREKANVCSLPRPAQLCERGKGPADEFCKKIARAVGGTSDASCFRKRTCKFHVKRPVQHPSEPGDAYVSLCVPEFAGVIFPCRENNLVVVDPFFNSIEEEDGGPPTENAPNWHPNDVDARKELLPPVAEPVALDLRGGTPWSTEGEPYSRPQCDQCYGSDEDIPYISYHDDRPVWGVGESRPSYGLYGSGPSPTPANSGLLYGNGPSGYTPTEKRPPYGQPENTPPYAPAENRPSYGQPENRPSYGQPENKPSYGQPENSPSYGQPENTPPYAPAENRPSYGQPENRPSYGQPENKPSYGQPENRPSYGQPENRPSYGQSENSPSYGQPENKPSYGQPENKPSYGQPENRPSYGQPENRPSYGQSENRPSYGQPGNGASYGQPENKPSYGQPENSPSYGQPENKPSYGQPENKPSYGQPGNKPSYGQPENRPSYGQPENRPSYGQPENKPSYGQPENKPSYGQPENKPSYGQPENKPSYGQPENKPSYGQPENKPSYGQPENKPSYGQPENRPSYGRPENKPFYGQPENKPSYGQPENRPSYGQNNRPSYGEAYRPSYGQPENRPSYGPPGNRPSWNTDLPDGTIIVVYEDEDFPSNKSTSSVRPTTPRLPTSDTRTSPGNRGDRLFGQYVAHKLTHMDPIQASIAEKLISEVLFEAESGRLNRYWKILEVTPQFPVLPLQPGNSDKVLQLQAPPILVQAQNSSQESDNLKPKTPSPSNHNNPPIIQQEFTESSIMYLPIQ
ncbi:hypothetical protein M8J77_005253 [Diaphorina citri]|nr:hypothetical protein M8J77_005253 [Diaphorina citri]